METLASNRSSRLSALLILFTPYLLNDFANIFLHDNPLAWIAVNYIGVKLFACICIFYFYKKGVFSVSDLGFVKISPTSFIITTVVLVLFSHRFNMELEGFSSRVFPSFRLGYFPQMNGSALAKLDLFVGIPLVGIFEEIIFRALSYNVLTAFFKNKITVLIVSTLTFGAIHWSLGLPNMLSASLFGLVYMIIFMKIGNIIPLILGHFVVDFIIFYNYYAWWNPQ